MNEILLLSGVVIVICILTDRLTEKLGVPSLLMFIALGMCFGVDGIVRIPFDNYQASELICSVSLIFIMFYGGFGTNLKAARPVIGRAVILSSLGVVLTSAIVGAFIHFVMGLPILESLLIASVIGSTDAASVFSILRSKNLNLKDHTASLLEMESGSNDPFSYMLTVVLTAMMVGESLPVPIMLFKQLFFGCLFGVIVGKAAVYALNKSPYIAAEGKTILVFAAAILAYTIPSILGGNGYLSVYLCGILMGNSYLPNKKAMVLFFDVLTGAAQMLIFFLLGLLATPSQLPAVFIPALLIMAFMTLIGRPVAVTAILAGFKASPGQIGIVSWAGLRGVASIVFSIYVVMRNVPMQYNLFNLVFCIVLLSISFQGTLLPFLSEKLKMIDANADVRKTFTDYQENSSVSFIQIRLTEGHPYSGKSLKEIVLPSGLLVVLVMRDGKTVVPNGGTVLMEGDLLVAAAEEFEDRKNLTLQEITVDKNDKRKGKTLSEMKIPKGTLVVMIQRGADIIIPGGDTVICEDDTMVLAKF